MMKWNDVISSVWDVGTNSKHDSACNCPTCKTFLTLGRTVVGKSLGSDPYEWFTGQWKEFAAPAAAFTYDIEMPGTKER